jgi:hypothetical protein
MSTSSTAATERGAGLLLSGPALALALLAAHFWRDGAWPLALVGVALVALLAWRRAFVRTLVQVALAAGAVEWAWTALLLVQQRTALGRPWGRLALILGVVTLLTGASGLALSHRRVRNRYDSTRSA